jgi:hypothetical protein
MEASLPQALPPKAGFHLSLCSDGMTVKNRLYLLGRWYFGDKHEQSYRAFF